MAYEFLRDILARCHEVSMAYEFLRDILASLIATYIPVGVGLFWLWRRYQAVRKVWGIRALSIGSQAYQLVMSSREDEPEHYRPGSSEAEAMVDLIIFFNDFWLRWLCRVTLSRPRLSAKVGTDNLSDVNLVLLGGPHFNLETKRNIERLARHKLPFSFREVDGTWLLRDSVEDKYLLSSRKMDDADAKHSYSDYGLYIRAPHERPGHVVHIFAGNHGAGTRAAVAAALKPHLCREILYRKKQQQIGSFFVVLVKVNVKNFEPGEPKIVEVGSVAVSPQSD